VYSFNGFTGTVRSRGFNSIRLRVEPVSLKQRMSRAGNKGIQTTLFQGRSDGGRLRKWLVFVLKELSDLFSVKVAFGFYDQRWSCMPILFVVILQLLGKKKTKFVLLLHRRKCSTFGGDEGAVHSHSTALQRGNAVYTGFRLAQESGSLNAQDVTVAGVDYVTSNRAWWFRCRVKPTRPFRSLRPKPGSYPVLKSLETHKTTLMP
jgi:hypothetical protein